MTLPEIPSTAPTVATAGDTWQWTKDPGDYLIADGWVLSYRINGPKALAWDATWATNNGSRWTIAIPKATTAGLTAGSYELTAVYTGSAAGTGASNGLRRVFPLRPLVVLPDPAAQTDGSRVSHAATLLPLIEAAIAGRVPADMQAYTLGGRQITKIPIRELRKLRRQYRAELWRENHPERSAPARKVRFAHA